MNDERQRYLKGRCYLNGKNHPYVVWDGVSDYESIPPPELFNAEKLYGRIGIVQISKTMGRELLDRLFPKFDSVVIWARSHKVYRTIVENLEAQSDVRLQ